MKTDDTLHDRIKPVRPPMTRRDGFMGNMTVTMRDDVYRAWMMIQAMWPEDRCMSPLVYARARGWTARPTPLCVPAAYFRAVYAAACHVAAYLNGNGQETSDYEELYRPEHNTRRRRSYRKQHRVEITFDWHN